MKIKSLFYFQSTVQRHKKALSSFWGSRKKYSEGSFAVLLLSGIGLWLLSSSQSENKRVEAFAGEKEQYFSCVLQKISDGDTVTALCRHQKIRIRLAGIDAPETGQKPAGELARRALKKQLPNHFTMRYLGQDYYHRALGVLYNSARKDINLQMIADGYAFAYKGKTTPKAYYEAEHQARKKKNGLWRHYPKLTNPKVWRRYHL